MERIERKTCTKTGRSRAAAHTGAEKGRRMPARGRKRNGKPKRLAFRARRSPGAFWRYLYSISQILAQKKTYVLVSRWECCFYGPKFGQISKNDRNLP
jgi:hypothetical protein